MRGSGPADALIERLRVEGRSLRAIVRELEARGVRTRRRVYRGREPRWSPWSVRVVLDRLARAGDGDM